MRQEELQAKFEKFGNVVEFDIVRNYGFVHFEKSQEAQAAANALNGTEFGGNILLVEMSHSKVRQKPGMGNKGSCFRCGEEGHWSKDCPKLGPRRPRHPPGPPYRDPYEDPYARDPYADPYYRNRYMPPLPPVYGHYDPYDPYEHPRPVPPTVRDPYFRDREPLPNATSDLYPRPSADMYERPSVDPYSRPLSSAYGRAPAGDPYARSSDIYGTRPTADPYARPPPEYYSRRGTSPPPAAARESFERDPYLVGKDPYQDYYEKRRPVAANNGANSATARVPGPY
ncbi:hypothetical protein C0Q70_13866 [Pomacea canaliculata]|uniref:RNA-binding protein lark n=1 Tax=Pomacea canaliculata TaxID=400727 RepID=A0A2T7NYE0_POMCA|nr:hypothetical protein C0Q70_13866 [Pomacea canaliculata]